MKRKIKFSSKEILKQNIVSVLEHTGILILELQRFQNKLKDNFEDLDKAMRESENENKQN